MNESKKQKADCLRTAVSLAKGLSPLDAGLHERITRSALGILRRDGHPEAATFFLERMPAIAEGFSQAEEAIYDGELRITPSSAPRAMTKYDDSARCCFASDEDDLGLRYLGVALFVLQRASTPTISPLRMLVAGDIVDRYLLKRYSPLSKQRAKCDAPHCDDPASYVRHGLHALEMATFCFAGAARDRRLTSILGSTLSAVEKLTAGYLLDVYDNLAKEETLMRPKAPRKDPEEGRRKDAPGRAPESGHGTEPYQTAASVVRAKRTESFTPSKDDPASAPESGDLD